MSNDDRNNIKKYNIFGLGIKGSLFVSAVIMFLILSVLNIMVGVFFLLILTLLRIDNSKPSLVFLYCFSAMVPAAGFFVYSLPDNLFPHASTIFLHYPIRSLINFYSAFNFSFEASNENIFFWLQEFFQSVNLEFRSNWFLGTLTNLVFEKWALSLCAFWGAFFALPICFAYARVYSNALFKSIEGIEEGDKPIKLSKSKKSMIDNLKSYDETGSLIGGDKNGKPLYISDDALNVHTLVIGTTGSGKTSTIANIIESYIERNYPVIVVDGKGDKHLARQCAMYAKEHDQKSILFTLDKDCKHSYNPFIVGDYSQMKDRIIGLFDDQNEYYKTIGENWIQLVFDILQQTQTVIDLHSFPNYTSKEALTELLRVAREKKLISKDRGLWFTNEIDEQRKAQEMVDSIDAKVRLVARSSQGKYFNTSDPSLESFNVFDAIQESSFLYFALETQMGGEITKNLGKLIVSDINSCIGATRNTPFNKPILLVFDEFGVFAGPQVLSLIKQGRDAGACCVLGTQNFADLEGTTGANLGLQIRSNCNNFICHALGSGKDDREIAAQIFAAEKGKTITAQIGGDDSTFAGTQTDSYNYVYNPAELAALRPGTGEGIIRRLIKDELGHPLYKAERFVARFSKIRKLAPPMPSMEDPIDPTPIEEPLEEMPALEEPAPYKTPLEENEINEDEVLDSIKLT